MAEVIVKKNRMAGLDGIRAFAILLVVGQHTGLLPESGGASIPLFFLLSGFFTAYSSKEEGVEERFLRPKEWLRYYVGRLFRIIPLYYTCIFFFWFFYPGICFAGQDVVLKHMAFYEVGVHFWFLQQEILMYLFAPVIIRQFRDDPNVIEVGVAALRWQCLSMCVMPCSAFGNMLFQSIGKSRIATFLASLRSGLALLPVLVILTMIWGLQGLEMSRFFAEVITTIVTIPFLIGFFRSLPKEDEYA